MKTNDQEQGSLTKEIGGGGGGGVTVSQLCKLYSNVTNGYELQKAFDERRPTTTKTTYSSYSNWTGGSFKSPTKLGSTEIQNDKPPEKSLYTVLNFGKPRPSVREHRRNTLPTLPVWQPQQRSRKTLSLSELNETEIINGTLTTTLCSTEL